MVEGVSDSRENENENEEISDVIGPSEEGEANHGVQMASTSSSTHEDVEAAAAPEQQEEPFSIFTRRQKIMITCFVALGGLFSPLSANMYFPALNTVAKDLGVSLADVNLTLTTYLIFQGLAPSFMGDLADMSGRRPTYMACFTLYMAANLGIALQDSFAALLVLRCLQSAGSSGTISLSNAVVADIAPRAQRGTYMGWAMIGPMFGPAIGPVIGGILAQYLGWRWIFWFLLIVAAAFIVPYLILCPETGRNVVGNGSIPPQGWNMSLLSYIAIRNERKRLDGDNQLSKVSSRREARAKINRKRQWRFPNPLNTLRIVKEKDVSLLLLHTSLNFSSFYVLMATTPPILAQSYSFTDLQIGLSFLPVGIGALVSSQIFGRVLDRVYRYVAAKHQPDVEAVQLSSLKEDPTFPIEKARLLVSTPLVLISLAAFFSYGWAVWATAPVAVLLVLQFFMGMAQTGVFNALSVLMVDLYPLSPATATAANNLVRCLFSAVATSFIQYLLEAAGAGWCYTMFAGLIVLSLPIVWILVRWSPKWREERRMRAEKQNEQKRAEDEKATGS